MYFPRRSLGAQSLEELTLWRFLVLATQVSSEVKAIHVDHGIRKNSDAEADFVFQTAQSLGATFESVAIEVQPGPNLEARARKARYSVLPENVLTGHTADDQAETIC